MTSVGGSNAPATDRPSGTTTCSRHGHGHTPRRRRKDGCTGDRFSGGGAGPRRRSAQGDLRLDNEPDPWHNSGDRLGLSELGAVTRVRWAYRALTPRLSPLPTLSERRADRQRRGRGRRRSRGRTERAHRSLENRVGAVSHSAHRQHLHLPQDPHDKTGARAKRTDECREFVTISRSLTIDTGRGTAGPHRSNPIVYETRSRRFLNAIRQSRDTHTPCQLRHVRAAFRKQGVRRCRGVWKQAEPITGGRSCPLQRTVRNDVMHRPRMRRRLFSSSKSGTVVWSC